MRFLRLVKPEDSTPDIMAMTKTGKVKRSVELPEEMWEMLGEDAKRTHRSINGMLAAYLDKIYNDADLEIRDHRKATGLSPVARERKASRAM